ncbi:uncharacterized protein LOC130770354 [Actinidia eriantha]|uniref:uncharacterized protein LOC130770354 n=1 Tax=Actinidia eriantha TaxID=165200 RepID=UPI0025859726|nr:uncharacterized protein LOC130770354 [Actinidia eriantha]XP_057483776.1 uncharacterized protein LOC130770354 [Actinidia eriantha]
MWRHWIWAPCTKQSIHLRLRSGVSLNYCLFLKLKHWFKRLRNLELEDGKRLRKKPLGMPATGHMDLKDKWKSLVKTANRPANKRRGAVIPQEILDRVLAIETRNSQQEAMQRFTEFSNSINGFEFDEDTISSTFDQSETLAKKFKFKFKDDPVDLNFHGLSFCSPDPNPVLVSLRQSGSSELDSSDDGDLSDDVFKYINSMLMEENMELKPTMFHDPLAIKAIEKSLYDVIGEKYPDSPNQPPLLKSKHRTPDSLFG